MKVEDHVMLSLLVIAASVPDGVVPLSRLGTVMSSALEKPTTAPKKVSVTVAVSPDWKS